MANDSGAASAGASASSCVSRGGANGTVVAGPPSAGRKISSTFPPTQRPGGCRVLLPWRWPGHHPDCVVKRPLRPIPRDYPMESLWV